MQLQESVEGARARYDFQEEALARALHPQDVVADGAAAGANARHSGDAFEPSDPLQHMLFRVAL